ncbi:TPA: hypothetical protein EYP37_03190, partial [Candidatus Poribacteria bacterium]|nr:hypothetical protein [Candidatus Poribacteria bacterium]
MGYTSSFGSGGLDVYLIKTDPDGNLVWQKTFGGGGLDVGSSVNLTSQGGFIVSGWTRSFTGGFGFTNVYLIGIDVDGNMIWQKVFGRKDFHDFGYSAVQTSDNGYLVVGVTYSWGHGPEDIYLAKLTRYQPSEKVYFPDPNLEAAVREAIGKPDGPIYKEDLVGLTALNAVGRKIVHLEGIEYCTELKKLYLSCNRISDLSPLGSLENLEGLYLDGNEIESIYPLTSLIKIGEGEGEKREGIIVHLGLSDNRISDISPLLDNLGIDNGDGVDLRGNPLNVRAYISHIPALRGRGVNLLWSSTTVFGTVRNGLTGDALPNVTIQVDGVKVTVSDFEGGYSFEVSRGTHIVEAFAENYVHYKGDVAVPRWGSKLQFDILLYLKEDIPKVNDVTSSYFDRTQRAYFLDGIPVDVRFRAAVDWGKFNPGLVRFISPKGTYEVKDTPYECTFNVGTEFGRGGRLKVVTISKEGVKSEPYIANFEVVPIPPGIPRELIKPIPQDNVLKYESSHDFGLTMIEEDVKEGKIPKKIPFFGGKGCEFNVAINVGVEVTSEGEAKAWARK